MELQLHLCYILIKHYKTREACYIDKYISLAL